MAVADELVWKIFLLWFQTASTGDGISLIRDMTFKTSRNVSSDEPLCSTDTSVMVYNEVRSKIKCTRLCLEYPRCSGLNWKDPSTCELFTSLEVSYKTVTGCTHMSKQFTFYYMKFNNRDRWHHGTVSAYLTEMLVQKSTVCLSSLNGAR